MNKTAIKNNNSLLEEEQVIWLVPQSENSSHLIYGSGPSQQIDTKYTIPTGQPVIGGQPNEFIGFSTDEMYSIDSFKFFKNAQFFGGFGQIEVDSDNLEDATFRMHQKIFNELEDKSLFRMWYFIPQINEEKNGKIENYKLFCKGRSEAFEDFYKTGSKRQFTASSATGSQGDKLTVLFLATSSKVSNLENPSQTPAYEYPVKYGPRAPSFSRASFLALPDGREWFFISGTASIRGSDSLFLNNLKEQVRITLENIDLTLQVKNHSLYENSTTHERHFKVFLRDAHRVGELTQWLDESLNGDYSLTIVEADICRADLDVEIELTLFPRP